MSEDPARAEQGERCRKLFLMRADEIEDDRVCRVEPDGVPAIAVYKVGGAFYATQDRCTHGNAELSWGDVEGEEIICPYHGGAFNIITGEATRSPCGRALQTYEVILDQGQLYCLV
jgi:nitrite reductase/ring-hydroxylating ferredoxin subunit